MTIELVAPEDFDWSQEVGPAADVRRIAEAANAADGVVTLNEQAVLQLKNRGLRDASLWLWLASGPDGSPADGFALRHGNLVDLAVHPDARERGVGTELAAAVAADGRRVEAWSHADHPGAARLAERFGLARERELRIMRRSLADQLGEVHVPPGVRIKTFEPSDEPALLEVNASAFAHHPEQGHLTHEDFRERTSEAWFDPAGLFLAVPDGVDGPELLGFHWTKVHLEEEPTYGEVYVVAVNPKAAGRGLGTLLTNVGVAHLRDLGLGSVLLYVDGDNDPAVAVYTNQGFVLERTEAQYIGTPYAQSFDA